jgi:hypothetical protein
MTFEPILIENIYKGGPIPEGCQLVKINPNLGTQYYGHCVRGQKYIIKPHMELMFVFCNSQGHTVRNRSATPMMSENQFDVLTTPDLFPEDLFTL